MFPAASYGEDPTWFFALYTFQAGVETPEARVSRASRQLNRREHAESQAE